MSKALPCTVSSYDLLKTFAVIIMIVDHMGYYFYPDDLWWRVIGRLCFPIWFFLIGHAGSRALPAKLWGGAFLLLGMNVVVGLPVFPLNALFTIIFLRLLMDYFMEPLGRKPELLWFMLVACLLTLIPTNMAMEYGTQAFMFAMFGYLVRYRAALPFNAMQVIAFAAAIIAIFLIFQIVSFHFTPEQYMAMGAGTLAVCAVLYCFRAATFPSFDAASLRPIKYILQLCGRRTLEIYIVHLLLFKLAALYMGMDGFGLFDLRLTVDG